MKLKNEYTYKNIHMYRYICIYFGRRAIQRLGPPLNSLPKKKQESLCSDMYKGKVAKGIPKYRILYQSVFFYFLLRPLKSTRSLFSTLFSQISSPNSRPYMQIPLKCVYMGSCINLFLYICILLQNEWSLLQSPKYFLGIQRQEKREKPNRRTRKRGEKKQYVESLMNR